jgi:hypothetical protein
MSRKRFLKYLLVVLALALWASTAYAQGPYLSPAAGTVGLTYTQFGGGSQAGASVTDVVSSADSTSTAYTVGLDATPPGWLHVACSSPTVEGDIAQTSTCTFSVVQAAADALATSPSNFTYVFQSTGGADATVTVSLTLTTGSPTLQHSTPSAISYTQFQAGAGTTSFTVSSINEDRTTYTDTYQANFSCAWLTVASANTSATDGSGNITQVSGHNTDTLTFTVAKPAADALAAGSNPCSVTITSAAGSLPAFNIPMTVSAGSPTLQHSTPSAISYTQFQAGAGSTSFTVSSTNEDRTTYTDTYQASFTCGWLTVASANTLATDGSGNITQVSGHNTDTLTFTVVKSAADALAAGSNPCSVTITSAAGSLPAFNIPMTVSAGSPTLQHSAPSAINYTQFQAGAATTSFTVSSTNEDRATYTDTYQANFTCGWLTVVSANTSATDGSGNITQVAGHTTDTLTFTVVKAAADALAIGSNPCAVTITSAAGSLAVFNIPMTVSAGTSTLTASSSLIALGNYAINSNASVTSSIGITSNDDSGATDTYTASTTCGWLTLSSASTLSATGGTVTKSSPDTLNLTLDTTAANVLALGSQAACNVKIMYNATTVATAPISLTIMPPVYATGTPFSVSLSYAKNGATNQAGATHGITVSSYDSTADTYADVPAACPPWLDITSAHAKQASVAQADTLTFTIDSAAANLVAPTASPVACSVALNYTGTQFATVALSLTITGMPMTASSSPITLIYAKTGGTSQPTATANLPVNSEDTAADTYTVDTTGCSNYLNVASAHTKSASAAQSDTLTFSIDSTKGDQVAGTPTTSCNAVLKYSGTTFATVPLTLDIVNLGTLSAASPTLAFTSYTKGATVPTAVFTAISDTSGASAPYSFTVTNVPAWVSCLTKAGTTTGSVSNTVSDTLTCSVVTAGAGAANSLNAGPESATIHLAVANKADTLVTVTLLIKAAVSPLNSNVSPVTLTYWLSGSNPQAAATVKPAISSSDPLYDTYSVTAGYPNWLTVSSLNAWQTKTGSPDTLTLAVNPVNVPAAGSYQTAIALHIDVNNPDLTLIVNLNVVAQPLLATPASISLTYTKSGGSTTNGPVTVILLPGTAGTAPLTLDAYTVPVWLNVSGFPTSATALAASGNIGFTVNTTVAAGMATGNYTATVGIGTAAYATHLQIPVNLSISNTTPSLSLQEGVSGSTIQKIVAKSATAPIPTFTPYSSDEPIPFTAACTLTTSETYTVGPSSCVLSSTSGIAYTLGYQITATLDPLLFSSLAATYGNTINVKVVITPQAGSAVNLTYQYTLQPLPPTIATTGGISPTSVAVPTAANMSNSLVVLITGTNFIGPQDVYFTGGLPSICPTQVWLGSAANALTTGYVVLSPTQLEVTIPEAMLPTIASGHTSNTLNIGLANQTQTTCPSAYTTFTTLKVTTSPVIYGLTSTATYLQPSPGNSPNVAAYELISIFGDQFGFATGASADATISANYQVPAALMIGGTVAHPTNLTATFTPVGGKASSAMSAPILFANQNQINAIVPSGVVSGTQYNVAVTSGTLAASDVFVVNAVTADPGIFTLASDGSGPGAIVNLFISPDYVDYVGTINGSSHAVTAGDIISVYLTGLGAPDSIAVDSQTNNPNPGGFPAGCVEISGTKNAPGYMQIANTTTVAANATTGVVGWKPPSTAWTAIDGAEIQSDLILGTLLPPCFTDPITVTFGTGPTAVTATTGNGLVTWAGFTDGSVAGLYQINVQIPPNNPVGAQPIQVTLSPTSGGTFTSPPNALSTNTVTIQLH